MGKILYRFSYLPYGWLVFVLVNFAVSLTWSISPAETLILLFVSVVLLDGVLTDENVRYNVTVTHLSSSHCYTLQTQQTFAFLSQVLAVERMRLLFCYLLMELWCYNQLFQVLRGGYFNL